MTIALKIKTVNCNAALDPDILLKNLRESSVHHYLPGGNSLWDIYQIFTDPVSSPFTQ